MIMAARIMRFEFRNAARSRWIAIYALLIFIMTEGLLRYSGSSVQALSSILNLTIIVVPLVCVIYGTTHIYNSREQIELLLSQPIARSAVYAGMYAAFGLSFSLAFAAGILVPAVWHGLVSDSEFGSLLVLISLGVALNLIFMGISFLVAGLFDDKSRGLGFAILIWLAMAVIYDGLVMTAVILLADYPLEKMVLGAVLANPVDLVRIVMMIKLDLGALLGYTGAQFRAFFGQNAGVFTAVAMLVAWAVIPFYLGIRRFSTKDF